MKIYVRERQKVGSGVKQPKFRVVAVTGGKGDDAHLKSEGTHFRKTEIEQIAADVGAEVVYLEEMPEEERGKMMKE
jgi:TPP-dependent indolepyruvate ferredoxin oxidoreductase alpha subunit